MRVVILAFALVYPTVNSYTQISVGGDFTLLKFVVAGGGGSSSDPTNMFTVTGTVGQTAAGGAKTNLPFTHHTGFWAPVPLAPTAASVTISGRILTDSGRPISYARISLTAPDGTVRSATSNSFGHFRLSGVEAGNTYVLGVTSRRYIFTNVPMVLAVNDELVDLVIVGTFG